MCPRNTPEHVREASNTFVSCRGCLFVIQQDGLRNSRGGLASAYLGLKVTRVIRVVRLLGAISFFGGGPSLAFDRSRQDVVRRDENGTFET